MRAPIFPVLPLLLLAGSVAIPIRGPTTDSAGYESFAGIALQFEPPNFVADRIDARPTVPPYGGDHQGSTRGSDTRVSASTPLLDFLAERSDLFLRGNPPPGQRPRPPPGRSLSS